VAISRIPANRSEVGKPSVFGMEALGGKRGSVRVHESIPLEVLADVLDEFGLARWRGAS
jgi:hypothetical protein